MKMSNLNDLGMYNGKNSIYDGMKQWVNIAMPDDKVCRVLLNVMMGLPYKPGFELRIFNKFIACNLLYKHLTSNTVDIEEARKLERNDSEIFYAFTRPALPAHQEMM